MPTITPLADKLVPAKAQPEIPERIAITRAPKPKAAPAAAGAPGAPSADPVVASENRDRPGTGDGAAAASEGAPGTGDAAAASVKLSPQLSAIARKEQSVQKREQALKDREKALEAKLAAGERFDALKAKLGAKDFSELETLGLSYDEYTQYLLAKQGGAEGESSAALKKLESEIENLKKNQTENAEAQFEETVSEYRKEIAAVVQKDPNLSTVKELKREDAVLQLILDAWEEDEEELTVEDACQEIEEYLVDEAMKLASTTRVKARLEEAGKKPLPPPKPGLRTLTQQVTATGAGKPARPLHTLSDSERYAEARRRVLEKREQERK